MLALQMFLISVSVISSSFHFIEFLVTDDYVLSRNSILSTVFLKIILKIYLDTR